MSSPMEQKNNEQRAMMFYMLALLQSAYVINKDQAEVMVTAIKKMEHEAAKQELTILEYVQGIGEGFYE